MYRLMIGKETRYVPRYAVKLREGDCNDDRVYRRAGIGANLLAGENLAAEFKRRNYRKQRSAKSSAAIYCRSCATFCPKIMCSSPMIESNDLDLDNC
jgi:hypothetical protein